MKIRSRRQSFPTAIVTLAILFSSLALGQAVLKVIGEKVTSIRINKLVCERIVQDQLDVEGVRAEKMIKECRKSESLTITDAALMNSADIDDPIDRRFRFFEIDYEFKSQRGYVAKGEALVVRTTQHLTKTRRGVKIKTRYSWKLESFEAKSKSYPTVDLEVRLSELVEYLNDEWAGNGSGTGFSQENKIAGFDHKEFDLDHELERVKANHNDDDDYGYRHLVEKINGGSGASALDEMVNGGMFNGDSRVKNALAPFNDIVFLVIKIAPDPDVCDESEYCSYEDYRLYLKDGRVISIELNETT